MVHIHITISRSHSMEEPHGAPNYVDERRFLRGLLWGFLWAADHFYQHRYLQRDPDWINQLSCKFNALYREIDVILIGDDSMHYRSKVLAVITGGWRVATTGANCLSVVCHAGPLSWEFGYALQRHQQHCHPSHQSQHRHHHHHHRYHQKHHRPQRHQKTIFIKNITIVVSLP